MMKSTFGHKLRQHRRAIGLTLEQLSDMSGVSSALLSQVERGLSSPSLRTLSRLRLALNLPSSFFFEDDTIQEAPLTDPPYICRFHDRPRLELGPNAPHKELLHHQSSQIFDMMVIEIPPFGNSGPDPIHYPSEKGGMVLQGELKLSISGQDSRLKAGDSFLFDGKLPHRLSNPLSTPLRLLWIIAHKPSGPHI